jgi:hypothetical protein
VQNAQSSLLSRVECASAMGLSGRGLGVSIDVEASFGAPSRDAPPASTWDPLGDPPLTAAVRRCDVIGVRKELAKRGEAPAKGRRIVNVEEPNEVGLKPLHVACSLPDSVDAHIIVQMLIASHADPDGEASEAASDVCCFLRTPAAREAACFPVGRR